MLDRLIIGNNLICLPEVDSTNAFLRDYVEDNKGAIEGIVVRTDKQLEGKGQRGNLWLSEPGKNLTFSLFLKPEINAVQQFDISKLVAVSIAQTLIKLEVPGVKLKWPNDIYANDSKIGGVLIENVLKKDMVSKSIIGIGLNVNQLNFDASLHNASSVKKILGGTELDLDSLLTDLLNNLDKHYVRFKSGNKGVLDNEYTSLLYRLNEWHQFEIDDEIITAKIVGVLPSGKLELMSADVCFSCDLQQVKFVL